MKMYPIFCFVSRYSACQEMVNTRNIRDVLVMEECGKTFVNNVYRKKQDWGMEVSSVQILKY